MLILPKKTTEQQPFESLELNLTLLSFRKSHSIYVRYSIFDQFYYEKKSKKIITAATTIGKYSLKEKNQIWNRQMREYVNNISTRWEVEEKNKNNKIIIITMIMI